MTLRELLVQNVAVVERAQVEPGAGFTVLTGETGSGKSICVNALRAALGERIDAEALRPGAERARVRAVFDNISSAVAERLRALDLADDELLTLSRELSANGRSTCRVNGSLVSQSVLRSIGDLIAEVTAQGASRRLLERRRQRELLDGHGGPALLQARQSAVAAIATWQEGLQRLDRARELARSSATQLAEARVTVGDLEPLDLRLGEDDDLAAECLRLRQAVRIRAAVDGLADAAGAEGGAGDALAAALPELHAAAGFDPRLGDLTEDAAALVEQIREMAIAARRAADEIVPDDRRLAQVEERLEMLAKVCRRHGSLAAALAALDAAQRRLAAADGDGDIADLERAATAAAHDAAAAVAALSAARAAAARKLERAVQTELQRLELPHARFRVRLERHPDPRGLDLGDGVAVRCHAHGVDEVEFRLAANRDMVPVPLDEGVSGGELSRLALAVSAVAGDGDPTTLILDEIDTGIGGETAARVGDLLAAIGARRQVLAVTHRAEIAARADTHLVLTKHSRHGVPSATVAGVRDDERTAEIARLMSGRPTAAALARAGELLAEGAPAHSRPRRAASTM